MQNPQARVHRFPLIMKVAVPSFQHSNMFGQPASSQTVTNRLSRIRDLRRRYSGPVSKLIRIHSGFRPTGRRPIGVRSAARPARDTSARSTGPWAHRTVARSTTRSTTSAIVAVTPSTAREVTP